MPLEIEHKFLVRGEYKTLASSSTHIMQGYICSGKGRTVRVRVRDDKGYLTIKDRRSTAVSHAMSLKKR